MLFLRIILLIKLLSATLLLPQFYEAVPLGLYVTVFYSSCIC